MGYGNGESYGAATTASSVPPAASGVTGALEVQAKNIDALHNAITELEGRLTGLLHADAPSTAASAGQPAPPVVMLSSVMSVNADRIYHALNRLQSICSRLDL